MTLQRLLVVEGCFVCVSGCARENGGDLLEGAAEASHGSGSGQADARTKTPAVSPLKATPPTQNIEITAADITYNPTIVGLPTDVNNVQKAIDTLATRPGVPGPQGPQGPIGPQGPAGPVGPVGPE